MLAALPILVVGPLGGFYMSIAATGLIYLSYFLCNLGVLAARRKGWPHKPAWFNLGRWGMLVNILALIWGGSMIINIGIWQDTGLFGDFGGDGRGFTEPVVQRVLHAVRQERSTNLPGWPIVRGPRRVDPDHRRRSTTPRRSAGAAHDVESADAVTGEAVIG